jgi:hypothetical protein
MLFIAREQPCRILSLLSFCLIHAKRLSSNAANPSQHHVGATTDRPSSLPHSKENTQHFSGTHSNANVSCDADEPHQTNVSSHGSDNESDPDVPSKICASHNSRSHYPRPLPSQLGFYKGHWIHILNSAKALFRYIIHTDVPFPECSNKNLKIAQECILEALSKYMAENEDAGIDKCQLPPHLCVPP